MSFVEQPLCICETTMIMLKCVWKTGFWTGKCTFDIPVVWSSMGFSHRGLLVSSWVILALHLIPINKTTCHTLFGWSPHATDWSKRHMHTRKGLLVRSWMETNSPFLCALTWVFSKRHWADFPTLSLFVSSSQIFRSLHCLLLSVLLTFS